MGTLLSKKEKSRITEQDKAILGLKKQRDQLKQYQKRINSSLEKDRELAKKLLKEGKKDRAKLLLRKKKFQEGLLDQTDKQLDQLERLTQDLEFSQVQSQVVEGLKKGNDALQKANSLFSTEDIEQLLDETQEAVEKQREIDELLSGQLSQIDEDEVLAELDQLIADEELVPTMPNPPKEEPQTLEDQLPSVPDHEPVKVAEAKKEKIAVAVS